MSQQTSRVCADAGVVDEMSSTQMFNDIFYFPTAFELLPNDYGAPGSKLDSNGHQHYYYVGGFNTQKERNMNMQGLEAIRLHLPNPANRGDYPAPANSGTDRHQSSEISSIDEFPLPAFSQSMASRDVCKIEQVPSWGLWQSRGGVNEPLLLRTDNGNRLLNNNHQFAPPQQVNHIVNWANSLQSSSSQRGEKSPLDTKFTSRDERSLQGFSLSLSSDSQVQVQRFETARLISSQDMVNRSQATADAKNKSVDVLNGYRVGPLAPFSRYEGMLSENRNSGSSGQFAGHVKQSKYMKPTAQLLNEFCSGKGVKEQVHSAAIQNHQKSKAGTYNISRSIEPSASISVTSTLAATGIICTELLDGNGNKHGLSLSGDRLELQRRKAKLESMLNEVERPYRRYCEQMKVVVSSFESEAGVGAATTYTCLAGKAMSRHFKCLKDAITGQIKAINNQLGEKESGVPGITNRETPRLQLVEQNLGQRLFQQVGMVENDALRQRRVLPERAVTQLRVWLFEHFLHPYPSDADKHVLARQTGLSRSQVSNWFINARVRLWKPMVEEMYQEEARNAEIKESDTDSDPKSNESHEFVVSDCNGSPQEITGNLCKTQSAIMSCIANENKAEGSEVGGHVLDVFSYNGNGGSNGMFLQRNVSLTLGLRHSGALSVTVADQEKYNNGEI